MAQYIATSSGTINTNTRAFVLPLPAGTAAVTLGSTTVTGTLTEFLKWLAPGDDIFINSERHTVKSITSNTVLITETAFAATASGAAVTYFKKELKRTGNRVVSVKALQANTGAILVGESFNESAAGTDVTASQNYVQVNAGEQVGPLVFDDLYNVFIRSAVASQVISLITNT